MWLVGTWKYQVPIQYLHTILTSPEIVLMRREDGERERGLVQQEAVWMVATAAAATGEVYMTRQQHNAAQKKRTGSL